MKELSYLKNTSYLILAGILSQIFAAVQKIILARYLKEEGMAIYQSALLVYSLFLTLACGGIPIAVTHFISGARAKGESRNILSALSFALLITFCCGLLLSLMMFFTRTFFSIAMKEPLAEYAIAALSPSVFIVAVGAVAKSCFEGHSNMYPCAISQVSEAIIKLILAYIFTSFFSIFSARYTAFGGALAITCGEAFATALLFAFFYPFIKEIRALHINADRKIRTALLSYALPVTAYAIILSSLDLLENAVIRNSLLAIKFTEISAERLFLRYSRYTSAFDTLIKSRRLTLKGASWLYGAFFGYALTIIRFPAGLLRTLSVSFFPIASKSFAEKNTAAVSKALSQAVKVILLISMPTGAIITIFGRQITSLIFSSSAYYTMLVSAVPILILSPLCSILATAEYAGGVTFVPFSISLFEFVISIPLCFILVRIPLININGAAIASSVGLLAELFLHLFFLSRRLKVCVSFFPARR